MSFLLWRRKKSELFYSWYSSVLVFQLRCQDHCFSPFTRHLLWSLLTPKLATVLRQSLLCQPQIPLCQVFFLRLVQELYFKSLLTNLMIKYRNFLRKNRCNGIPETRKTKTINALPKYNKFSCVHAMCTQCASHNRHKQSTCILLHGNVWVARGQQWCTYAAYQNALHSVKMLSIVNWKWTIDISSIVI